MEIKSDRKIAYNDIVGKNNTCDTRLLPKFDGKMIRNKYIRKTMEHVYNKSKAFYETWARSLLCKEMDMIWDRINLMNLICY